MEGERKHLPHGPPQSKFPLTFILSNANNAAPMTLPDRILHAVSSLPALLDFSRKGSEYLCATPGCPSHCLTVYDKSEGIRRFKGGFKASLDKHQIMQFNRSRFCSSCEKAFHEGRMLFNINFGHPELHKALTPP